MQTLAERDPTTHALLTRSADGTPRRNPLQKIIDDAADQMVRFASEFGCTPAARARIVGGISGPPTGGKFDGLLA